MGEPVGIRLGNVLGGSDGSMLGTVDGVLLDFEGDDVGICDGLGEGKEVGSGVSICWSIMSDGELVGIFDGADVGLVVGPKDGDLVGPIVGPTVGGVDGIFDGADVGSLDG